MTTTTLRDLLGRPAGGNVLTVVGTAHSASPATQRMRVASIWKWGLRLFFLTVIPANLFIFTITVITPRFGIVPMVVSSGSMEPAIAVGAVAMVDRDFDMSTIVPGDVVTYASFGNARLTTHRVVAVSEIDVARHIQTKGDANDTPDANLTPVEAIVGRVEVDFPFAGRLWEFSATPMGRILMVALPAMIILTRQIGSMTSAITQRKRGALEA